MYKNLIYDKVGIAVSWEKIIYLLKGAEKTGKPLRRK